MFHIGRVALCVLVALPTAEYTLMSCVSYDSKLISFKRVSSCEDLSLSGTARAQDAGGHVHRADRGAVVRRPEEFAVHRAEAHLHVSDELRGVEGRDPAGVVHL